MRGKRANSEIYEKIKELEDSGMERDEACAKFGIKQKLFSNWMSYQRYREKHKKPSNGFDIKSFSIKENPLTVEKVLLSSIKQSLRSLSEMVHELERRV